MAQRVFGCLLLGVGLFAVRFPSQAQDVTAQSLPKLPKQARLAFEESWSSGRIDPARWYPLRKKWGQGNNGVSPENVSIQRDVVDGKEQNVLRCLAHGDRYDGPLLGYGGQKTRVGGVLVTKKFFASGRYQVRMKVGAAQASEGGPADPMQPKGAVPAIWTYAYRWAGVPEEKKQDFARESPLLNPLMRAGQAPATEYSSEIDFPELGRSGDFSHGLFNTFCQNRDSLQTLPVPNIADGKYHTYTMEWRTELKPVADVKDEQVVEHQGFWWVQDKAISINAYLANPLKRLGKDQYAAYWGQKVDYWVDGRQVGSARRHVPAMAAQLTLGIWLPQWGGVALWKESSASFSTIRIWEYDDPGDVRGVLTEDVAANF